MFIEQKIGRLRHVSRARAAALEKALRERIRNSTGHSEHWDPTGQSGAGCPACIRRGEANESAYAVLCDKKGDMK